MQLGSKKQTLPPLREQRVSFLGASQVDHPGADPSRAQEQVDAHGEAAQAREGQDPRLRAEETNR